MSILGSDNFNRADTPTDQSEHLSSGSSVTWSGNTTGKFFKIVSNVVQPIDVNNDVAERVSSVTWPSDQYSKIVIGTVATTLGTGGGPGVRWDTSGNNTGYRLAPSSSGFEL